jgi:FAD/FMN-containing dehydrogenase
MLAAYDAVPMRAVCFGHLGNNHLHLNLLPANAEELAEARKIYLELARKAVSLGGTVSAEHGIGRLKKAHLALMASPSLRAGWMAMRKMADPNLIFGRGVMVEAG